MHQVMVFSTSASAMTLNADRIASLTANIPNCSAIEWLSDHAAEIIIAPESSPELSPELSANGKSTEIDLAPIREMADEWQIDVNLVTADNRRKMLLIADMDSTIIEGESLDDMAELAGLGAEISAITARAMRGELDFEQAIDARVGMLAGRSTQLFQTALDETKLMAGAQQLVATMRAHGAHCYLVSGGFTAIAGPIATRCGFDGYHANEMIIDGDSFAGTVVKPVLGRDAKAGFLAHYCTTHNLDADDSLCVGDGANDLGMLEAAGYGVAYHGKPLLRAAIDLQFNHSDLTGLLYLQGYHQRDFAG